MATSVKKGGKPVVARNKATVKKSATATNDAAGPLSAEERERQAAEGAKAATVGAGHEQIQDPGVSSEAADTEESPAGEGDEEPGEDMGDGEGDIHAGASSPEVELVDDEESALLAKLEQLRLNKAKKNGGAVDGGYVPKMVPVDNAPPTASYLKAGESPVSGAGKLVVYRLDNDRTRKATIVEGYSPRICLLHVHLQSNDTNHGANASEVANGIAIRDEVFEGPGIGQWRRRVIGNE